MGIFDVVRRVAGCRLSMDLSKFGFGGKKEKSVPDIAADPFRQTPLYAVIRTVKKTAIIGNGMEDFVNHYEMIQGLFRSQARAEEYRDQCVRETKKVLHVTVTHVIRILATDF